MALKDRICTNASAVMHSIAKHLKNLEVNAVTRYVGGGLERGQDRHAALLSLAIADQHHVLP